MVEPGSVAQGTQAETVRAVPGNFALRPDPVHATARDLEGISTRVAGIERDLRGDLDGLLGYIGHDAAGETIRRFLEPETAQLLAGLHSVAGDLDTRADALHATANSTVDCDATLGTLVWQAVAGGSGPGQAR